MATNHTEHCQLSQWEPGDQVLRTDFNADHAKLDAALEGRIPAGMKDKVHEFADLALDEWDFSDEAEEPRILTLFKEIVAAIDRQPKPGRMDFSDINDRAAAKVDAQHLAKSF